MLCFGHQRDRASRILIEVAIPNTSINVEGFKPLCTAKSVCKWCRCVYFALLRSRFVCTSGSLSSERSHAGVARSHSRSQVSDPSFSWVS